MDHGHVGASEARAATGSQPSSTGDESAAGTAQHLLECWQTTADEAWLERLLEVVKPAVMEVAQRILVRHGIRDPGALDDTMSLVFDHLRRLPHPAGPDRRVAPFEPHRVRRPARGDAGIAYVAWLTRDRALDVIRRQRRRSRRCRLLDDAVMRHVQPSAATSADDAERSALLHAAIARLPPRERLVCDLLLDGRSQAEIAGLLGLCAGTVSRIRQRSLKVLRDGIDAP